MYFGFSVEKLYMRNKYTTDNKKLRLHFKLLLTLQLIQNKQHSIIIFCNYIVQNIFTKIEKKTFFLDLLMPAEEILTMLAPF